MTQATLLATRWPCGRTRKMQEPNRTWGAPTPPATQGLRGCEARCEIPIKGAMRDGSRPEAMRIGVCIAMPIVCSDRKCGLTRQVPPEIRARRQPSCKCGWSCRTSMLPTSCCNNLAGHRAAMTKHEEDITQMEEKQNLSTRATSCPDSAATWSPTWKMHSAHNHICMTSIDGVQG